MMPTAPLSDTMRAFSDNMVRPPLSTRITALIQATETPNRREALTTAGFQRCTNWDGLIACSFWNAAFQGWIAGLRAALWTAAVAAAQDGASGIPSMAQTMNRRIENMGHLYNADGRQAHVSQLSE